MKKKRKAEQTARLCLSARPRAHDARHKEHEEHARRSAAPLPHAREAAARRVQRGSGTQSCPRPPPSLRRPSRPSHGECPPGSGGARRAHSPCACGAARTPPGAARRAWGSTAPPSRAAVALARPAAMSSELYRNTAIGECLDEALAELGEKINPELRNATLKQARGGGRAKRRRRTAGGGARGLSANAAELCTAPSARLSPRDRPAAALCALFCAVAAARFFSPLPDSSAPSPPPLPTSPIVV